MGAVIAFIELRVDRVLAFQHPRRMRHADEELRLRIRFPGSELRIEGARPRAHLLARLALHRIGDSWI